MQTRSRTKRQERAFSAKFSEIVIFSMEWGSTLFQMKTWVFYMCNANQVSDKKAGGGHFSAKFSGITIFSMESGPTLFQKKGILHVQCEPDL